MTALSLSKIKHQLHVMRTEGKTVPRTVKRTASPCNRFLSQLEQDLKSKVVTPPMVNQQLACVGGARRGKGRGIRAGREKRALSAKGGGGGGGDDG